MAWQGRYKDAYKTITRSSKNYEAYNNIGYIALQREDFDIAISYFKKALELNPTYYVRAAENLQSAEQLRKQATRH